MIFMACTTCKRVVQSNATGTCLGCQRGFVAGPQEDSYEHHKQEEKNNALQKPEPEEVLLRESPTTREKVRKRNEKRKKVTSKGKKN